MRGRELRDMSPGDDAAWHDAVREVAAGIKVTPTSALECAAVNACVQVRAEDIASIPLILYRRTADGRERATDHPLYSILHDAPNPEMSAKQLRQTWEVQKCLYGSAYSLIEYDGPGNITALWPLNTAWMTPKRDPLTRVLYYEYRDPIKGKRDFRPDQILHIRSYSLDGISGISPVEEARQVIGLALAVESFGARFFANDATHGLVLESPTALGKEAVENLKGSFPSGLVSAHKIRVLEEDIKLKEYGVDPEKAQTLELQRFCVEQIARYFRVQPALVGDHERSTFSNVYGQIESHVKFCLRPIAVEVEQEISRTLLGKDERDVYYAEHNFEGLLRADTKTRYEVYAVALQNGMSSINEARRKENDPPVEGGDKHQTQVNLADIASDDVTGDGEDGNDDADKD